MALKISCFRILYAQGLEQTLVRLPTQCALKNLIRPGPGLAPREEVLSTSSAANLSASLATRTAPAWSCFE